MELTIMKKSKEAATEEHHPYTSDQNHLGLERLMFFSDAVFAIAITVLVLDIHLPTGGNLANDGQLLSMLVGLWHKYLAYIISFWVIGLYWINHHRKFLHIKRFDHTLLSLNLLLLMVIAFIPFPTSVISENANLTATIFYALIMAVAGLVLALLWFYAAYRHNLIDAQFNKQRRWREAAGSLVIAAIFLLSIGVVFISPGLVRVFWLLIIPVSLILNVRRGT
jgi:TMEM175 potassium channel family protein